MDIKTCRFGKNDINTFKETIFPAFSKYARTKKEYFQANEVTFMTKNLYKEIMMWSTLRNKYLKSKSLRDTKYYNTQSEFCKKLVRTTEKDYFFNLDTLKNSMKIKKIREFFFLFFQIKIEKVIQLSQMKMSKLFQTKKNLQNIWH